MNDKEHIKLMLVIILFFILLILIQVIINTRRIMDFVCTCV